MKTCKLFVILFLLSVAFSSVKGQLVSDLRSLYHPSNFYRQQSDTSSFEPWRTFTPGKTDYSFEIGTGYSSFGGGNGFSASYVSPMISYSPTERFQVVAGGKFSYTNIGNASSPNIQFGQDVQQGNDGNPVEFFTFGRYLVNSRLSIYGMGAFGKNQLYLSPYQSGIGKADYQQYAVGFDYKISDKASIGASINFNNGPAWGISPFSSRSNQYLNPFFP